MTIAGIVQLVGSIRGAIIFMNRAFLILIGLFVDRANAACQHDNNKCPHFEPMTSIRRGLAQ